MAVCKSCRNGEHHHDRRVSDGTDAGCPYMGIPGDVHSECACPVVLPPTGRRPHCPTCHCDGA